MALLRLKGVKAGKWINQRVEVDGKKFASIAEAARYGELQLMERAGMISALESQPKFRMEVNGELICTYIGDFAYIEAGQKVVEDVKSPVSITPVYRLKKKLLRAIHGIEVREVQKTTKRR